MDLNERHHNEQYLYGRTKVATLDNEIKEVKPNVPKVDVSKNILMDTSIKKVMQKNRELHKELYLEREKNKKLEAENKSLLNKLKRIKNKEL